MGDRPPTNQLSLVKRHGYEQVAAKRAEKESRTRRVAASLRYDGPDFSEFQYNPVFSDMVCDFIAIRSNHGTYRDPTFVDYWREIASLPCRWKIVYFLPTTLSSAETQASIILDQIARSGVPWRPGMGYCWDVEGANAAGADTIRRIGQILNQELSRPNGLLYTGVYSPVSGMGYSGELPWWVPWPVQSNGPLDEVDASLVVVHQWGTAGPGEIPGFPTDDVDVNQVNHEAILDEITGAETVNIDELWTNIDHKINEAISVTWQAAGNVDGHSHEQYMDLVNKVNALTDTNTAQIAELVTMRALLNSLSDPKSQSVQTIAKAVVAALPPQSGDLNDAFYKVAHSIGAVLESLAP